MLPRTKKDLKMTDTANNVPPVENGVVPPTEAKATPLETKDTPKEDIAELQAEVERLRNHNTTLLGEKKTALQKATEDAESARLAMEEKAKADGDYETLLKAREEELSSIKSELTARDEMIANKAVDSFATAMAMESATDANGAEILKVFFKERVQYLEGKEVILDTQGNPSGLTKQDLIKEFQLSGKFNALMKGSGADGGGVTGSHFGGVPHSGMNQRAETAKKAGDLTGFLSAQLSS